MYIIEFSLKSTPMTLSVQKKSLEDAEAVFQLALDAIKTGNPAILEATCEQQPDKKIAARTEDLNAVQMYEKSGTSAASGRPPGFFALSGEASA